MLATKKGKLARFDEENVRAVGRNSIGVKGVTLDGEDDEVIGMICVSDSVTESVLVVSEKGYGKRSEVDEYRKTNRGAKGVKTINVTEKTGDLISIKIVQDNDDLMIINKSGITIRMNVNELRVMGRATQGVRLIRLDDDDAIASVAKVEFDEAAAESTDATNDAGTDISGEEQNSAPDANPPQPE